MTSAQPAWPSSLAELTNVRNRDARYVDLGLPEIGGGRFSAADVRRIRTIPEATVLRVSGLDQSALEALVTRFGTRLRGLHLWKCPRISDLSPMEDCRSLTHVAIYWNQRVTRLWDPSRTPDLRGLGFHDFTHLRSLDDLAGAASLTELEFGDAVWVKAVFDSLSPLESLANLRRLAFHCRRISDGRIEPLAKLQGLESIECSTNLFTTEQLAWLRARLPDSTQGRVLEPIQRLGKPLAGPKGVSAKDVLVIGRRKPFLSSSLDADRINRYVRQYWERVAQFRQDPSLGPG